MIYRKIFYFSDDALALISNNDEELKDLWIEYAHRRINYADVYLITDSIYKPPPLLNFIPGLAENKTFYATYNESPF